MDNQDTKVVEGKPQLTLVPPTLTFSAARAMQNGLDKGYTRDSWQHGELDTYLNASYRHLLLVIEDLHGKAEDSNLSHLDHLAACVSILCWHRDKGTANTDGVCAFNSNETPAREPTFNEQINLAMERTQGAHNNQKTEIKENETSKHNDG